MALILAGFGGMTSFDVPIRMSPPCIALLTAAASCLAMLWATDVHSDIAWPLRIVVIVVFFGSLIRAIVLAAEYAKHFELKFWPRVYVSILVQIFAVATPFVVLATAY